MGFKSYFALGKASASKPKAKSEDTASTSHESPTSTPSPTVSFTPSPLASAGLSPMSPYGAGMPTPPPLSRANSYTGLLADAQITSSIDASDLKCDVMANYLHHQLQEKLWTSNEGVDEGVVLKQSRGKYACCPANLALAPDGFLKAIEGLNVRVAITITTNIIKLFLRNRTVTSSIPLSNGLRLQVLPSISSLPRCQKHHFAAFIADRAQLVVWDDDPRNVLPRAIDIVADLLHMIWDDSTAFATDFDEKQSASVNVEEVSSAASDIEVGGVDPMNRPRILWQPVSVGLSLMLLIAANSSGFRAIAIEIAQDHGYIRLCFAIVFPLQVWLSLFFFQALVCGFLQLIGPVSQVKKNSTFYSGIKPRRIAPDRNGLLPHVTIQMPVYKEGLFGVIEPTIRSIKAAMSTYEMQGGTTNIFINDDGMQVINATDAQARREFYEENNIGWVARPKHNEKPVEGELLFLRRGRFKKASNMNYAMWISNRIESRLENVTRPRGWTNEDEYKIYHDALREVVEEDEGRTWADGNIRIGDYILIIDSDTRVPRDCFLDAVSEMEQSPSVGILQYSSGVMNVTDSYFERAITYFTELVYTQIRYAVANGDSAPFVGHNAVLRWSVIQHIGYDDALDEREKWWSEATVSEDFDMSLRLQGQGYIVRLGAYTGNGFQEGVSLTVYDELARWEKYAYGCSELIFHPFALWPRHGPFTPLFRAFISSRMPFATKVTIMAYVGTYYAIGSAWLLTLVNYFVIGWFNGFIDHYYSNSFEIFFAIILVFTTLGNLSLAVLRYRTGERELLPAIIEVYKWVPLLTIFLGGISVHVSQAILSHMLGIDMTWGATSKEEENLTFFEQVPKVLKGFRFTLAACLFGSGMMVALGLYVLHEWRIHLFIAVWPLATQIFGHLFLPIVLNPRLMLFTW